MQFASIFMIIFWCILCIYAKNTAKRDKKVMIQPTDDDFNIDIENAMDIVRSEMLRGKKQKTQGPARNCLDLKKKGKASGSYKINPCDDTPSKVVDVYCDMDTEGGGWTVIQRRDNYPDQQNFYFSWLKYIMGFGDVTKDFWLGNENIHCLTKQSYNEIRFDLTDWTDATRYAKYGFLYVHDEANKFKLVVDDYSGTAGDSFTYHNGQYFSTFDTDNDASSGNCASSRTGAWWYDSCYYANLNGVYNATSGKGLVWYHFKGWGYSLKKTEMKIRPKNN